MTAVYCIGILLAVLCLGTSSKALREQEILATIAFAGLGIGLLILSVYGLMS